MNLSTLIEDREMTDTRDKEVEALKLEITKLKRQLETANAYNEDLRQQVINISKELLKIQATNAIERKTEAVQVTPSEIEAAVSEADWLVASEKANVSLADCVRAAAEEVTSQAGYVYDETSGYYYDSSSGYYYDAERSLYYDANSGVYFYYNTDTQKYEFHSQVEVKKVDEELIEYVNEDEIELVEATEEGKTEEEKVKEDGAKAKKKKKNSKKSKVHHGDDIDSDNERNRKRRKGKDRRDERRRRRENRTRRRRRTSEDGSDERGSSTEEGECSDSMGDDEENVKDGSESSNNSDEAYEDGVSIWPPCIRVIILETNLEDLDVGTLFLVTCTGAIVGREKKCDIPLPNIEISKAHAKFTFKEKEGRYEIMDMGSQNGTFVNGVRLSDPKTESEYEKLKHGDVVQFGTTKMLLHIHKGSETCDDCEPGIVQAIVAAQNPEKKEIRILSKEEKELERRRALKQIKKKFGLETTTYTDESAANNPDYQDRAGERRKTKGSDNPYEKTEVASVNSAIPSKNKGFKMLEKMGWSSGQSLGKSQSGIVEPIKVETKMSKVGLGYAGYEPSTVMQTKNEAVKRENWSKAQKRYQELEDKSNNMATDPQ